MKIFALLYSVYSVSSLFNKKFNIAIKILILYPVKIKKIPFRLWITHLSFGGKQQSNTNAYVTQYLVCCVEVSEIWTVSLTIKL